jgi:hypothetical protein
VITDDSMDIAMRVVSRAREVLPEGPQRNPNRPQTGCAEAVDHCAHKPSQSVRTVSGGPRSASKGRQQQAGPFPSEKCRREGGAFCYLRERDLLQLSEPPGKVAPKIHVR